MPILFAQFDGPPRASATCANALQLFSILLIAVTVCFWRLGEFPFRPSDESLHVKATQNMLHHGELWQPRVDGELYFRKPPFKMWLSLLPVAVLGESNFSYRLLDASAGLLTALITYRLGAILFSSWAVGFWAALALLGCRYYLLFHGVRNAVQDSMLVLLTTLAMLIGWRVTELLSAGPSLARRRLLRHSGVLGVLVGLAVLTKSVAGFLPLFVIGGYILISGQSKLAWRHGKLAAAIVCGLSLVIPALYYVPHALFTPGAWEIIFGEEVYGRFKEGMHNSRAHWFYLTGLFCYRSAVPPELLTGGGLLALLAVLKRRDRQSLYVLCWAFIPLLLYGNLRSRMPWYIAPAFPAMSLLAGFAIERCWTWYRESRISGRYARSLLAATAAALGSGLIFFHLSVVLLQIAAPPAEPFSMQRNFHEKPNLDFRNGLIQLIQGPASLRLRTDLLQESIRGWERSNGTKAKLIELSLPAFAQHESIYLDMLESRLTKSADLSAIGANGGADFVVAPLAEARAVAERMPVQAYAVLPPENRMSRFSWHRRHVPLVVLSASAVPSTKIFRSSNLELALADAKADVLFGFGDPQRVRDQRYRLSMGPRSALVIEGDRVLREFGARITLSLTNRLPTELTLKALLNDREIGTCSLRDRIPQQCSFTVDGAAWNLTKNVLTITYSSTTPIGVRDSAAIVERAIIHPLFPTHHAS